MPRSQPLHISFYRFFSNGFFHAFASNFMSIYRFFPDTGLSD